MIGSGEAGQMLGAFEVAAAHGCLVRVQVVVT